MIKTKKSRERLKYLDSREKDILRCILKTNKLSKNKLLKLAQNYKDCKEYQVDKASQILVDIVRTNDDTTNTIIHYMFRLCQVILDKTAICDFRLINKDNEKEVGYLDGQVSYYRDASRLLDALTKDVHVK
jgi:hypothetical protein